MCSKQNGVEVCQNSFKFVKPFCRYGHSQLLALFSGLLGHSVDYNDWHW